MNKPILIYGATGYTGQLIATHARERRLPIIVAGRTPQCIDGLSASLGVPGRPTPEERAQGRYAALAEVTGRDGEMARSMISTATGYTFTQHSSIEIARRAAEGDYLPGFQSPASAYGPLAASIAGTRVTDL